jgi:hypothetical protein
MERYYDKRPKEHRKRAHYNRKGVKKQVFIDKEEAQGYIERKHLNNYIPYLCYQCNYYHIGRISE